MSNENSLELTKSPEHKKHVIHDVLVVDDEPAARQKLILFLQDHKDLVSKNLEVLKGFDQSILENQAKIDLNTYVIN